MIVLLENNQIDRRKWNDCIQNSRLPAVYLLDWYLDIVSPGWKALISDNYEAVMPLTWGRKLGVKYIFQPMIVQQSGIIMNAEKKPDKEMVSGFLRAIPASYIYIDYSFNEFTSHDFFPSGSLLRKNHVLQINHSYQEISANYSRRCRRNLKTSEICRIEENFDSTPDMALAFFRKHLYEKIPAFRNYYVTLGTVIRACMERGMGELLTAVSSDGEIIGMIFYMTGRSRCTMVLCASTPQGLECQTMYFLIDRIIRKFAGKLEELDFFGSNIPSIEYFNLSFGAETRYYPRITINRLPFVLKFLYK